MGNDRKISTGGGESLAQNPFGALSSSGLPVLPTGAGAFTTGNKTGPSSARGAAAKDRGRVDVKRTTAGRGGKTVTLATNFVGIGLPEKEMLAKKIRAAAGCGGTVKDGSIEIQGDQREMVARILAEAGFRPVFAGG